MAHGKDRGEEFDAFYRAHFDVVRAYCLRRASAALADDAVAETFEIAWRRWAHMPRQPKGWLLGVARRVLANRWRAERRQANLVARLAHEPRAHDRNDEGPPVLEALARLSPDDVEILKLAAWDELSSREAGQVLGCSPVAFRLRVHRARRRLAAALDECEGQSDEEPDGVIFGMGEPN